MPVVTGFSACPDGWGRDREAGLVQALTLEEDCTEGQPRTQKGKELLSAARGGVNPKEPGTPVRGFI